MDTVDNVASETRCCPHRWANIIYLRNDGELPPVLLVETAKMGQGPMIVSLTNTVIRVACPTCYQALLAQLQGKDIRVVN